MREAWVDPMPPNGLAEHHYAAIRAREGRWHPDFLHVVETCYRGVIPDRFERRARAIAARPRAEPTSPSFYVRVWVGELSFLVDRKEIIP